MIATKECGYLHGEGVNLSDITWFECVGLITDRRGRLWWNPLQEPRRTVRAIVHATPRTLLSDLNMSFSHLLTS